MSAKYLPANAEEVTVEGATVPFHKFTKDGITYYQFDTSMTGPPEPMVNAMCGLNMVTADNIKLNMINHKKPMGLFDKIAVNFDYVINELEPELYCITFSFKGEASLKADLTQKSCG